MKEVFRSTGSIAMTLGFLTGCFQGDALKALGHAATLVLLLVVGASNVGRIIVTKCYDHTCPFRSRNRGEQKHQRPFQQPRVAH